MSFKKVTHGDQQQKLNPGDLVVSSDGNGGLWMNEVIADWRGRSSHFYGVELLPIAHAAALEVENEMIDFNQPMAEIEDSFYFTQRRDRAADYAPWATEAQMMELEREHAENYNL